MKKVDWYSNWECSDKIRCPYCGKIYDPSYEETFIGGDYVECYLEGVQGAFTCDVCGKKFRLSIESTWEYTTETIDGEMTEEQHDRIIDEILWR